MKHLFIVVLLVSCSALVSAQEQTAVVADPAGPPPQLKAEDLLKIRTVQYEGVKRALQMAQIEAAYKSLQEQQQASSRQLDELLAAAARAAGVDTSKWVFDFELLKFAQRPAPAAAQPTKQPAKKKGN